jgi:myo-inositol-1(or 4)-monophosphatase
MGSNTLPTARSGRSALAAAEDIARRAGEIALAAFRQPHEITVKGRGNVVTETDFAVERFIKEAIAEEFPDHRIVAEETAADGGFEGWCWVVDPIDGTKNFVSGIPFWCVNIALCVDGEPVVAVTQDPTHSETFAALRGGGLHINGRPAHASEAADVQSSVVAFDLGYDNTHGHALLRMADALFPGVQAFRVPGSAALGIAYAACGRFDLFMHRYLFPWDIAAGILLVREGGGAITEENDSTVSIASRTVLAGSPAAHADFLRWSRSLDQR